MMKKIFALLLMVMAVFGVNAADMNTYRLEIKDFIELEVVDDLNVVYRCNADSAGFAVFTCAPDIVPGVMFSNNKNKLKIMHNNDTDISVNALPVITVYSNFIQSAVNCGKGTLTVESPAPGSLFKARVIGNGTLVATEIHATQVEGNLDTGKGCLILDGVTRVVKLKNIGTGTIEAMNLQAETGTVTILGTGPVECNVTSQLTVNGMGTGKVSVKGNPEIKKRTLGSIAIENVE